MTEMTVSETLNKAADLIEREGWLQGAFGPRSGPHCSVGAIRRAAEVGEWEMTPYGQGHPVRLSMEHLEAYVGAPSTSAWNDTPGRTAEEVIATLRAAALVAAANESQPSVEAVRA